MTKMNGTKKVNKLTAIVIAVVMMVIAIGFAGVSQVSIAADKAEGLAAHEQVMDDNAACESEAVALETHEQVND